jgi:hypothetical protein
VVPPPGARMSTDQPGTALPPALRRILEIVYGVEGVVAARVWQTPGTVAVGVRGGPGTLPAELLRRVESAVIGLREPGVAWDFGWLQEP